MSPHCSRCREDRRRAAPGGRSARGYHRCLTVGPMEDTVRTPSAVPMCRGPRIVAETAAGQHASRARKPSDVFGDIAQHPVTESRGQLVYKLPVSRSSEQDEVSLAPREAEGAQLGEIFHGPALRLAGSAGWDPIIGRPPIRLSWSHSRADSSSPFERKTFGRTSSGEIPSGLRLSIDHVRHVPLRSGPPKPHVKEGPLPATA